ncbi:MAG: hypothetical protein DRO88_07365 [Promethearchaeia archaeon]|nr:MAG: hypothetical protein DRO88_07365 [Candidatus Lokiarchaeia archaeon]
MFSLIEFLLIGAPYIDELPIGAKRAYKITQILPILIQPVKDIAQRLYKSIQKESNLGILTGFPIQGTFETDGPLGAFILGDFLASRRIQVNLILESPLKQKIQQLPWNNSARNYIKFTSISQLDKIPPVMISIEYPGQNIKGICHNMKGYPLSQHIFDIESMIDSEPPKYWLGIGDGGNELGLGKIRSRIIKVIKFGKSCRCECGGGIAAFRSSNEFLLGITSNLASLIITYELSILFGETLKYSWKKETQLLARLNSLGIIDGITGKFGTVDSIPPQLAKKIIGSIIQHYSI